jgi:RNA-directed DNA polymerase
MIEDRAKQALCKLVLEPEWEARFEPNSYGFRPERSCHDAVEAVLLSLRNNVGNKSYHKYILSAKITNKGIHQIDHDYLVTKLRTLP